VSTCLLWCLWRESNDRNFKDRELMLEDLKSFFFFPYTWIAVFLAPLVTSFKDFLVIFSPSR
jgi:hypothetical protein